MTTIILPVTYLLMKVRFFVLKFLMFQKNPCTGKDDQINLDISLWFSAYGT